MSALAALAAAAATLGGWLFWRRREAGRARRAARRAYFDAVAPHLAAVTTGIAPDGFARLNGQFEGRLLDLQAVPDALTFRKVPALWVLVSLPGAMPVEATLDVMMRPTGHEPFSRFGGFGRPVAPPPGAPPGAAARSDDPALLPDAAVLRPHLAMLEDPAVKELVISPKGLRVVFLAEEADRARYLLFREAEMGAAPVAPGRVLALARRLAALAADLEAAAATRRETTP
ncbi:MAG: hypothetical protein N2422_04900 [Rhodobacteraceae bacterium]|nr:hypothetical protein [Paracoccaceae bacterium]